MRSFIIISIMAVVLVLFALGSGVYNMAATEKHWAVTEKFITWVRESSIKVRAEEVEIPELDEENLLGKGFVHFDAMCTECHLAPGKQSTELAQGLYPEAPVFHDRAPVTGEVEKQYLLKKYFWVIKHGIKMTAMPAWGVTHSDESIWQLAAFILQLHGMTPERYAEFAESHGDHRHQYDIHH